jgi:excisionase family DNA binding protein
MIDNTLIQFHQLGKYISIQTATEATGYNIQYLRRLLRAGKITGIKIGQVWLIEFDSMEAYLRSKTKSLDMRCGPKNKRSVERTQVC